jgi:hypothetical protein
VSVHPACFCCCCCCCCSGLRVTDTCVLQAELLAELEGEMYDLRDQLAQAAGAPCSAGRRGSRNKPSRQLTCSTSPHW